MVIWTFFLWNHVQISFAFADIDTEVVPPTWPLDPTSLRVEDGEYELRAVPLTSIAMLSNRVIKVRIQR